MIVIKITNSSELVAAKVGKLIERFTPDTFDLAKVEEILISKLIENLSSEGLKGEVASVRGLEFYEKELIIESGLDVRQHRNF